MAQCRSNKKNQILKYILNKETPEEAFEPDTEEEALLELIARKVKSGYYGANVSDALIEQFITEYLTEHPIEAVEIANNLTTATTGKALDATQGKALKDLLDALSERIDNLPAGGGTGGGSDSSINDSTTSTTSTYSSSKIDSTYAKKTEMHTHSNKSVLDKLSDNNGTLQYNGSDITGGSGTSADVPVATTSTAGKVKPDGTTITVTSDGTISATATTPDLSDYQTKTDSSLTTTAKTIVGAINEVKQTASTGVDTETITAVVDAYMEANPAIGDKSINANEKIVDGTITKELLDNNIKLELTNLDGEITDGRTGVDGEIYNSIGEAIREQINKIKYSINTIIDIELESGGISGSTGEESIAPIRLRNINYIDGTYYIKATSTYAFYLYGYNKNDYSYLGIFDKSLNGFYNTGNFNYYTEIDLGEVLSTFPDTVFRICILDANDMERDISTEKDKDIILIIKQEYKPIINLTNKETILTLNKESESTIKNLKRRLNTGLSNSHMDNPEILTLLHFSDLHNQQSQLERVVEFKNYYNSYIDDIIHTGDSVLLNFSDGISAIENVDGANKILNIIGNHDADILYASDITPNQTQETLYNTFFKQYKENTNIIIDENKTYWYKDYSSQKIRLIGLNSTLTNDDLTNQNTWLEQTLSLTPTDYSVVIMQHYPPENFEKFDCNFTKTDGSWSLENMLLSETYLQTVDDFKNNGGNFICWLGGHTHFDMICKNPNYPNQLFIHVANTFIESYFCDYDRIIGDKSQDVFNIISFDTTSKNIKIVRVGADRDVYLRHRGIIVINYSNQNIVYSE